MASTLTHVRETIRETRMHSSRRLPARVTTRLMTDEESRAACWSAVVDKTAKLAEVVSLVIRLPMTSAVALVVNDAFRTLDEIRERPFRRTHPGKPRMTSKNTNQPPDPLNK
jgi:hypothetical protein